MPHVKKITLIIITSDIRLSSSYLFILFIVILTIYHNEIRNTHYHIKDLELNRFPINNYRSILPKSGVVRGFLCLFVMNRDINSTARLNSNGEIRHPHLI